MLFFLCESISKFLKCVCYSYCFQRCILVSELPLKYLENVK